MSSLGFLSEAGLLWWTKLNPFTYFLWSSSLWNIIVFGSEIELLCAFVNIIYLHALMHLREHLTWCSSSRQRVGVNLGVLISWHGVHVPYILSLMPSLCFILLYFSCLCRNTERWRPGGPEQILVPCRHHPLAGHHQKPPCGTPGGIVQQQ